MDSSPEREAVIGRHLPPEAVMFPRLRSVAPPFPAVTERVVDHRVNVLRRHPEEALEDVNRVVPELQVLVIAREFQVVLLIPAQQGIQFFSPPGDRLFLLEREDLLISRAPIQRIEAQGLRRRPVRLPERSHAPKHRRLEVQPLRIESVECQRVLDGGQRGAEVSLTKLDLGDFMWLAARHAKLQAARFSASSASAYSPRAFSATPR